MRKTKLKFVYNFTTLYYIMNVNNFIAKKLKNSIIDVFLSLFIL